MLGALLVGLLSNSAGSSWPCERAVQAAWFRACGAWQAGTPSSRVRPREVGGCVAVSHVPVL